MSYTKIKKFNDSFELLHSLAYGEDFLREYASLCEIADTVYKSKKVVGFDSGIPDTDTLFGYTNFIVIPIFKKLQEQSLILFPANSNLIIKQVVELIPKLLKVSKLWDDVRFDSNFADLSLSFDKLLNLFTDEDLKHSFFKETGFASFMATILKLGHKERVVPIDPIERLHFYNLYPVLQHFKKDVLDKSNLFSKTKYAVMYQEILDSAKESRSEMLAVATLMHKSVNKYEKNKTTIEIEDLKHPVRWEQITILFNGDYIKIKQIDTLLGGEIYLEDVGIHKAKKKGAKTSSLSFFTSLFIKVRTDFSDLLDSTNNLNQQNKMTVSKALKDLFNTAEDPIVIDDKKYVSKFKASPYGPLAEIDIENYRSGGDLYE